MSKKPFILFTLILGFVCYGPGRAFADSEAEDGHAYFVWGEMHRYSIDFYINKLKRHSVVDEAEEAAIRKLLNHEADVMVEIQMKDPSDIGAMLKATVEVANETHQKLAEIFTKEQLLLLPSIIEARKQALQERMFFYLDGLWAEAEEGN